MARARNIKPGFFTNDDLCSLPPLARLLFAGLWTVSDREGRLEDKPKKLKVQILGYDECDVDALLDALDNAGFIVRYRHSGARYIQICEFKKHQNPHVKEPPSVIPDPNEPDPEAHGASTVQAPDKHQAGTEVAVLIPDSPSLIPDSLEEQPSVVVASAEAESDAKPAGYAVPPCQTQAVIDAYAEALPMLPQVAVVNDARRRLISARWREVLGSDRMSTGEGVEFFRWFFHRVRGSPFLTGSGRPDRSGRVWRADLDWLMSPTNFARVIEGRYHNEGKQQA